MKIVLFPFYCVFLLFPRNYYSTLANSKLLDINNDVIYFQRLKYLHLFYIYASFGLDDKFKNKSSYLLVS